MQSYTNTPQPVNTFKLHAAYSFKNPGYVDSKSTHKKTRQINTAWGDRKISSTFCDSFRWVTVKEVKADDVKMKAKSAHNLNSQVNPKDRKIKKIKNKINMTFNTAVVPWERFCDLQIWFYYLPLLWYKVLGGRKLGLIGSVCWRLI